MLRKEMSERTMQHVGVRVAQLSLPTSSIMKSSRRARSTSNAANNATKPSKQRPQSPQKPPVPPLVKPQPGTGMTPASRYNQNLKVLKRNDPSIISIFDQFSHVCLYHHNGTKWEKKGFEGSMFLFERQAYPPYGFFILNRMGMEDYVRHMYPEDDMEAHGDYLMYRSYPDFTAKRLAMARSPQSDSEIEDFTDAHGRTPSSTDLLTNWQLLLSKSREKGPSETVGLWMFATDAREPLKDVMMRLHSYIRKVVPYPEEFRYGPDRPPPPPPVKINGAITTASISTLTDSTDRSLSRASAHSSDQSTVKPTNRTGSELDKLFSKLVPTSTPTPVAASDSKVTLQTLFAAAAASPAPTTVPAPSKGLSLLDSIFASATPSTSSSSIVSQVPQVPSASASPFPLPPSAPPTNRLSYASPQPASQSQPQSDSSSPSELYPDIHSPKPTISALPQILNQDVISALLGFPQSNSRASSVASSHRRYEGDVESSDNDHDDHASFHGDFGPSTAYNNNLGDVPTVKIPNGNGVGPGHVLGDVTPRPPPREFAAVPLQSASSTSTVTAFTTPSTHTPNPQDNPRTLVPFQSDSNLWPYPRAPVDDRDGDVVVLDFADTSALNDLEAFDRRRRGGGKGKKGRRERERDNEREREQIERGWDVPAPLVDDAQASAAPTIQPVSSPSPAPVPAKERKPEKPKSTTNGAKPLAVSKSRVGASIVATMNGQASGTSPPPAMERNAFVREVLTLIHTDKDFVDRLWEDYKARA
ncbi:hypothetical protein BV25DRAFT_125061 [Artomyces pyxidatus]|uniref:Uncharacterized protein n=1 Tax=Artomyces pyxidatus TaxID=48021 RepID=A0ACB8T937_9AGAM|nr:hypothetical protein BV25DRAFT_125061 [Artomyces pyxidatus]